MTKTKDYYLLKAPLPLAGRIVMKNDEELLSFFNQLWIIHAKNKSLDRRLHKLLILSITKLTIDNEILISWDGAKIWMNDLGLQQYYRDKRSGLSTIQFWIDSEFETYFERNPDYEGYFTGKDFGI